MSLGGQTVTLRSFTEGTKNRLNQSTPEPHDAAWTGVLMRPFRSSEAVTLTDIATGLWYCTGEPIPAALNATATGELIYNDDTYQIVAVEPFSDFSGTVTHVRITCQKQVL